MLQLTLDLVPDFSVERRKETRTRTGPIPARLTDLYRDQIPVTVLNISRGGLGVKVEDPFAINLPVLLECDGLLIVAIVRHCITTAIGGFVLGLKTYRIVETSNAPNHPDSLMRAVLGYGNIVTMVASPARWAAVG
jgi:hypothetical protein